MILNIIQEKDKELDKTDNKAELQQNIGSFTIKKAKITFYRYMKML